MTLSDYLAQEGLTIPAAAQRLGASYGAVVKWKHGTRIPDPQSMAQIWSRTNGLVRPDDFIRPLLP